MSTIGTTTGTSTTNTGTGDSTGAKDKAAGVANDAKDATRRVGSTAKDEAGRVAHEAKGQARQLLHQTRDELTSQAGTQQQKLAQGLRGVGDELHSMAGGSDEQGIAADIVQQVGDRISGAAQWLEGRDPGSLLSEVKDFARRRPGVFIAVAAGAGILAGRLVKSLSDSGDSTGTGSASGGYTPGAGRPDVATGADGFDVGGASTAGGFAEAGVVGAADTGFAGSTGSDAAYADTLADGNGAGYDDTVVTEIDVVEVEPASYDSSAPLYDETVSAQGGDPRP